MANELVTVACKLPNGIQLQVGEKKINLNGSARFVSPQPGRPNRTPIEDIVSNYALTQVPKDFWEAWLNGDKNAGLPGHRDYEPVKNGLVYAMPSRQEATAKAHDGEKIKSGLEPLDPTSKIGGTEPTEEMLKALARR